MATAGQLGSRVSASGGAALLIDYGRNRPYPASLQAIRQHKFCGLLEQPGLADLSAHVDFSAIRCQCCCDCMCHWILLGFRPPFDASWSRAAIDVRGRLRRFV